MENSSAGPWIVALGAAVPLTMIAWALMFFAYAFRAIWMSNLSRDVADFRNDLFRRASDDRARPQAGSHQDSSTSAPSYPAPSSTGLTPRQWVIGAAAFFFVGLPLLFGLIDAVS